MNLFDGDGGGAPHCAGVRVSWATPTSTPTSTVRYGYEGGNLTLQATGSAVSYFEQWSQHTVLLPSLVVNAQVFYQCGDDTAGWSDEFSFDFIEPGERVQFNVSVFGVRSVVVLAHTRDVKVVRENWFRIASAGHGQWNQRQCCCNSRHSFEFRPASNRLCVASGRYCL